MDKINELQNVEASKITSSEISNESPKTEIFHNPIIYSGVFTGILWGTDYKSIK